MNACIEKATGRLILSCSMSSAETLLANGVSAGLAAADLEVREVTAAQLADLVAHNAALDEAARPAAARRAERYRAEVDPLVVVWSSYMAEGATDKAAGMAARITATKAQIREEISG